MAEIINHSNEDNPRLNEIYQILLLAGYFRIRIASLNNFDKVIGGIAWCITSSNFEIEVDYNDQMQIGQKIKVAEQICHALKNMNCPYTLQPFQLQGLDVNNIFPVVQWLVKFVYETRWESQKYNREISVLLGKSILKLENKGNVDKIPVVEDKRSRINKQIVQMKAGHPIRVYSALLQFNDATSLRMYHKLHNIIFNKAEKELQKKKGGKSGKHDKSSHDGKADEIMNYLQKEDTEEVTDNMQNDFGQVGKFSLEKLEKMLTEHKDQLQEAIKQSQQSDVQNIQNSEQPQSQTKNQAEDKSLKTIKIQNDKYLAQIKVLQNQLQSILNMEQQIEQEKSQIESKKNEIQSKYQEQKSAYVQILEIQEAIEAELAQKKSSVSKKLEALVQKKIQLKQKKGEIKKKAKVKIQSLQQKKLVAQASVPEIDQEAFQQMIESAEMKKQIFDKKYEELTRVNQDLAIMQRKAENFTSPAQVAQYHQRFIELFQSINCLIQEKRNIYNEMTNLESIKKMIGNYQQFLANVKDGLATAKKKNQKKELAQNIKEILQGFQANMKNSQITLDKLVNQKEASSAQYFNLIKLERQYLKVLRNFKIEYENVYKLQK